MTLINNLLDTMKILMCNVQYRTFHTSLPKILGIFKSLQKRRSADKATVLGVFSKEEWNKLASDKKGEHKLFDCGGCMNNPKLKEMLACFFITARFKKLAEEKRISGKPTKKFDKQSAKVFIEESEPPSILNTYDEFIDAKSIRNINTAKKETAVVRNFGGAVSLSSLNRHRMVDGFESKKASEVRTLKNITDIKEGRKRQHDHVGYLDKLSGKWNLKACLDM